MDEKLLNMILGAAKMRREPVVVPREFIEAAHERILNGEYEVYRYPSGMPSVKDIYEVAAALYAEAEAETQTKH